jgi:hypothetical protein
VDVLRSCYSSTWNFPGKGHVRGRYYFVDDKRPFYPGWSFFGSANWHRGDGTPWPEFGELEHATRKYDKGAWLTGLPLARLIGSQQELEGIPGYVPVSQPTALLDGVDTRCWDKLPWHSEPIGGDQVGGFAMQVNESSAIGGDQVGGLGSSSLQLASDSIGGDQVGGSSTETFSAITTSAGGDQVGGSSTETFSAITTSAGGDEVGGSSTETFSAITTTEGGDQVGGSSATGQAFHFSTTVSNRQNKVGGSSTSSSP